MLREMRVLRETSRGRTIEWSGTSRTSSNVSALVIARMAGCGAKAALYARGSRRQIRRSVIDVTIDAVGETG
jgi:hypothetical protein